MLTAAVRRVGCSRRVRRAHALLSSAWFGQQEDGAGTDGGPTRRGASNPRHSPHGGQAGLRHASRGDGTHTWN